MRRTKPFNTFYRQKCVMGSKLLSIVDVLLIKRSILSILFDEDNNDSVDDHDNALLKEKDESSSCFV